MTRGVGRGVAGRLPPWSIRVQNATSSSSSLFPAFLCANLRSSLRCPWAGRRCFFARLFFCNSLSFGLCEVVAAEAAEAAEARAKMDTPALELSITIVP